MTPDYDVATFETWRRKAEEDFAAASILAEHGGPAATICFLCQQTAEKYLKGYLLLRSQPPKRIHQLDVLLELVQTWIIHFLLILGEAASGLSVEFRKRHPERVWAEAVGRRNILIHRYFGVDVDLVWPVVENDLPVLKRIAQDILAEYPPDSGGIV